MSKRDYSLFLADIFDCGKKIESYAKGRTYANFLNDSMFRDAVIRNLEIIGEAAKHLPRSFRLKYPEIDWARMAGFRDIAIHEYFAVDYEIVWSIVQEGIPVLLSEIKRVIQKEQAAKK